MKPVAYDQERSFEYKYEIYKKLLFRIAYAYMENTPDTEDILQRAFIKLLNYGKAFPSEEDEKRWLIRITINLCKDEKRSFWNRNRCYMEELEQTSYSQEEREVLAELHALPDKYKVCIHLHYIEGYSVAEISSILKISESAVKMRLKRGREKLRLELEETV